MKFVLLHLIYFIYYGNLQFRLCCCKCHYFILFNGWIIFSCIYLYLLYPFICWRTFSLLPHLGYCKQHCNEHWSACVLSNHVFLFLYMPRSGIAGSYDTSIFSFVRNRRTVLHGGCMSLSEMNMKLPHSSENLQLTALGKFNGKGVAKQLNDESKCNLTTVCNVDLRRPIHSFHHQRPSLRAVKMLSEKMSGKTEEQGRPRDNS